MANKTIELKTPSYEQVRTELKKQNVTVHADGKQASWHNGERSQSYSGYAKGGYDG